MTTKDEALKMAIEFIHKTQFESGGNYYVNRDKTIQACKEALEQPKEWISLSDDEIWNIANFLGKNKEWDYPVMVAKTIEKALKEKNAL